MLQGRGGKGRGAKGRRLEYKFLEWLRDNGWYTIHQPRSLFPDIIAFKEGMVIALECKVAKTLSRREIESLLELKRKHNFVPLRGFPSQGRLMFEELLGIQNGRGIWREWDERAT